MPIPDSGPTLVRLDLPLDGERVAEIVGHHLGAALAAYLPDRRWYGDKDRPLASVSVRDVATTDAGGEWFALAIVDVEFADGGDPARYFLPLAVVPRLPNVEPGLAVIETPGGAWRVLEAVDAAGFPAWLLRRFETEAVLAGRHGRFHWRRFPTLSPHLPAARVGPIRIGGAEQSNSSIRYGDAVFVKVFRRLRAGTNPDEELSRFLTERTSFRQLPVPLASAAYDTADGESLPTALAFTFVPSVGDGWSWTLALLAKIAGGGQPETAAEAARLLGERTGQLHRALASDAGEPAFAPEPASTADVATWERTAVDRLRATLADLQARAPELSPRLQARIADFAVWRPELEVRAAGFRGLIGSAKTRIHGDYHLGQVLRTPDQDWVILDFEGEPARSIAERRAKTSPLKDVAGMLRSFSYARGAALRTIPAASDLGAAAERLAAWETTVRGAFLAGYRAEVSHALAPLVPSDDEAFAAAVAAWELDKAIYEVAYELGNRPDWLDLPLAALIWGRFD